MKKIPSLFKRDYQGKRLVINEVVEGCEWVLNGEGRATVKIDGTSCLIEKGRIYRRYDARRGKTPPAGFIPAQDEPDENTGHWPGWLLIDPDAPGDRWHWEAWELFYASRRGPLLPEYDGTYELVGPKVQSNPYKLNHHELWRHGADDPLIEPPRDFEGLKAYFEQYAIEGIVWHHEDGVRLVKIKRRDFGYEWPPKHTPEGK